MIGGALAARNNRLYRRQTACAKFTFEFADQSARLRFVVPKPDFSAGGLRLVVFPAAANSSGNNYNVRGVNSVEVTGVSASYIKVH